MTDKDETKPSAPAFPTLTDQQCVNALAFFKRVSWEGDDAAAALVDLRRSVSLILAAHRAKKQAEG